MTRDEYYSNLCLAHHGILGQKWGVRRYQNEDGTLTEAGKKHISKNPDKTRKEFQKAVNSARAEKHGGSNRWLSGLGIGENSDKIKDEHKDDQKKWEASEEYKKADAATNKLYEDIDSGKISMDDYDAKFKEIWKDAKAKAPVNNAYAIRGTGREYINNYVDTIGKELTIAYCKDLGFDEKSSKYIQSVIKKSKKKVLD